MKDLAIEQSTQTNEINCHYVTESLTKEWEIDGGWLSYFNFQTENIEKDRSRNLFAKIGLNSLEIEQSFNNFIETHLGRFKKQIKKGCNTEIDNWKMYRALHLYFIGQKERLPKAKPELQFNNSLPLDSLFEMDESHIDLLVQAFAEKYNIATLDVTDGHLLFFPETGFFQFPIEDEKELYGFSLVTAVPLTPYTVMAWVTKSANLQQLNRGIMEAFSVGLNNNTSRILIPPVMLKNKEHQEIKKTILSHRENAKKHMDLISQQVKYKQKMMQIINEI